MQASNAAWAGAKGATHACDLFVYVARGRVRYVRTGVLPVACTAVRKASALWVLDDVVQGWGKKASNKLQ